METHGIRRGLPHVLVEVRNDLISDANGIARFERVLTDMLQKALAGLSDT